MVFKAKAEDVIRQEVIEDLKGDNEDFYEEDYQDQIDRITQRRLKDEQFKASVHESKEKKKAEIEELKKGATSKEEKPKGKENETPKNNENYSIKDIRALNDIDDDDLDDFLDLTKKFQLSPSEAKKNKDVQAILKSRAEERKTAEATNVGTGKRGSSKVSGDSLLHKANETGKLPESDKDMQELVKARYSPRS